MRTRHTAKPKRGFTLIEILIVVVILGILAAIVIPQFAESADSANENSARSTLQTIRSQFELCKFHGDCDCDPDTVAELLTTLVDGGYLQSTPTLPGNFVLALESVGDCERVIVTGEDW